MILWLETEGLEPLLSGIGGKHHQVLQGLPEANSVTWPVKIAIPSDDLT